MSLYPTSSSKPTRLTDKYPNAFSDFRGCGTPCVYKSGPEWPAVTEFQQQRIIREARPVYNHPIQPVWLEVCTRISQALDTEVVVQWTSIGPRAYANAGEPKPFCPFIVRIGVVPSSLTYDVAFAAAAIVKGILANAKFPQIEVAFVESLVTRSSGPRLLSLDPFTDRIHALKKPFTPTLGLAIAPMKYPYYEGTAALFLRLADRRVVILTCAHVVRPPPIYITNAGLTSTQSNRHREQIVALGTMAFDKAVKAILASIETYTDSIEVWNREMARVGEFKEGEDPRVTLHRKELQDSLDKATLDIREANTLHDKVTKNYTTLEQRLLGAVLHSEPIDVSVWPTGFTKDWALITVDQDKIDWASFKGNKVCVGMYFSRVFATHHRALVVNPS